MSELRKQLRGFAREYAELRYPGDLAADILRRQSRSRWMRWAAPLTMAVAAAVAVAVLLHRPDVVVRPVSGPEPEAVADVTMELLAPETPGLPGEATFVPSEAVLLPAGQSLLAPVVPSLWETSSLDITNPNTKEPV